MDSMPLKYLTVVYAARDLRRLHFAFAPTCQADEDNNTAFEAAEARLDAALASVGINVVGKI